MGSSIRGRVTYVKLLHNHVVHGHPHRAAPVILIRAVKLILLTQAANTIRAKQLLLVANEFQNLAELGVVGLHQANHEGEDGNVALVAHERMLLKVIDRGVAVASLLVGPVQVIDVVLNGLQVLLQVSDVFGDAQRVGNVDKRLGHETNPRDEVNVQLGQ